ncbi:cytochrome P450 [Streptomyces sp. NPDC000410]|uniref:cytochrome P450 n=1 Tax=Streptomyces sp. NPDC000410 TaxID=3154254 RepID=UPI00333438D3
MTDATTTAAPVRHSLPGGVPLLGHLPAFAKDPLAFFAGLRAQGDLVEWRLGRKRSLFLSRPEHIHELLAGVETRFRHPHMGWAMKLLIGDGVVSSVGADWRRKRGLVQPSVRPRQVRSYATTMAGCAAELAERWKDGDAVNVQRSMADLTQRIAVRTLFGVDTAGRENAIGAAMDVAQREIGAELTGVNAMVPYWIPTPGRRRLKAAVAHVDAEVARIIAERSAGGEERDDLFSRLAEARDEQGLPLTAKELRDEAVTLYVAGHETTSTTLTWAWYLLSRNPRARARLSAELGRVLGGRAPGYEDYQELRYTQQVIKETLRVYPVVWLTTAIARKGATLGGHPVPDGTRIWTSQWSTHHDERWFPEPEAFRPERWDDDAEPAVPDHAWYPFGAGPRTCLGTRFALVEAVLVLATLAQRFHLDVAPGEIRPKAQLTLQPGGPVLATVREL